MNRGYQKYLKRSIKEIYIEIKVNDQILYGQSGAGLASVTVMPTFRYGWSFYAAVAAFINAELAAGLYIVLHTHLFKRFAGVSSSVVTRVLASSQRYNVTPMPPTNTKEVGVQTTVEKPRAASPNTLIHHQVNI